MYHIILVAEVLKAPFAHSSVLPQKAPPYLMSRLSVESFSQLMGEYVVGQIIMRERDWQLADQKQVIIFIPIWIVQN